ncbi:hypothetical protein FOZ60_008720 [Perkinsus olseni]|uniref:Uncharacterized protein n=1 Tax=Perkinsus olseni TaxID=32597 RepID=A0A7J6PDI2_PEROL|nr:hypothetical protein FOZ60_008720 [Perkinsus olseni]
MVKNQDIAPSLIRGVFCSRSHIILATILTAILILFLVAMCVAAAGSSEVLRVGILWASALVLGYCTNPYTALRVPF